MKQLNYTRSITEALKAKGTINEDATTITYLDEDKNECVAKLQDLLDKFASQSVAISIKTQSDEDLDIDDPITSETD